MNGESPPTPSMPDYADDRVFLDMDSTLELHNNCANLFSSLGPSINLSDVDPRCLLLFNLSNGGEAMFMGPPWWSQVLVQTLYALVCLIGLAGNTLVIYVVVRFSKMQTVTNLYIVNLAIADECFLVGIPFLMTTAILGYWPFGNFACKAYFTSTSINQITSSMFLLIMSADRYMAVCHPISAPKWRTPLIAKTVALTAWTLSALLMVPIFMYANTLELDNKVNCNIFWPESGSMSGEMIFIVYSFILGFAVPLILILMFYVMVIRRLRTVGPKRKLPTVATGSGEKDSQQVLQHNKRAKERKKSHRKVTKLVMTVVHVYFLCWAPYWATQMALIFMPHDSSHSGTVLIVFLLTGCLSYSNSMMNPILYAFLSDNFKKSFKKACSCASRKEINATLNQETSIFPRNKKGQSYRQRKSSCPMTSATYAGTGMETTAATRSTAGPSPHLSPPQVPVSQLIPDIDDSTSDHNCMTAVVITQAEPQYLTPKKHGNSPMMNNPRIHITINDHYQPDDIFSMGGSGSGSGARTGPTLSLNLNKSSVSFTDLKKAGNVNDTFVQDNGVVVTAL